MCDRYTLFKMNFNMEAFLLALAMVESGNNPNAVGKAGERTEYQITRQVWKQHSKLDFKRTKDHPFAARCVAINHIRHINGQLPKELRNQIFWIAVVWNGGMRAVEKSKMNGSYMARFVPKKTQDFADRVRSMYYVYEHDPRCAQKVL